MSVNVDSDSHLVEPNAVWTEYSPAAWREQVPQIVHQDGVALMKFEGQVFEGFPIAAATIAEKILARNPARFYGVDFGQMIGPLPG